ncbi:MAG: sulfatase [Saprospiraceae bacterium]
MRFSLIPMKPYQFVFTSTVLILSLGIFACSNSVLETDVKPNVVLILADDLGYGDLSYFGQKEYTTPQIDELASKSVICTDFYVPTPYCAPSRATLLTGRFPLRHGLIKNPTPDAGINDIGIAAEEITLGEVFQQEDYATMCIGKWHLGHKEAFFPVHHGFDEYYGILYSNDMRPVQIVKNLDTVEYPVDQNLLTQKYTEQANDFISKNKNQSFFLYLSHAMPHKPLAASEQFYTPDTPEDLYADVMRELDWSVGAVMKQLKDLEILDNTIVIFMSDNGPWYGGSSGGLKGMKATTWEGGIRVPFMIYYPTVFKTSKKITIPCWSPDIYPTLKALTNISPINPRPLDGQDITDILQGNRSEHPPVFSMHNNTIMPIRKGDWKLFVNQPPAYRAVDLEQWSDPRAPDNKTILAPFEQATPAQYPGIKPVNSEGTIQLYNLKDDPTESNNLAAKNPERVQELMQYYQEFRKIN